MPQNEQDQKLAANAGAVKKTRRKKVEIDAQNALKHIEQVAKREPVREPVKKAPEATTEQNTEKVQKPVQKNVSVKSQVEKEVTQVKTAPASAKVEQVKQSSILSDEPKSSEQIRTTAVENETTQVKSQPKKCRPAKTKVVQSEHTDVFKQAQQDAEETSAPENEETAEKKLEEMTAEELKKKAEEEIKEKRVLAAQERPSGKFKIRFRKKDKKEKGFGKFKKPKDGLTSKRALNFKQYQDKLKEEILTSAKWLANKENLKKVLTNKQNIAIGLSVIALVISVSSFINARNTSPIDKNNPFVKLNEISNKQLGVTAGSIGESNVSGSDNNLSLDPSRQAPKGITFNSEKDFKDAVNQALNDIKNDQVKEQLAARFKKYSNAPEKAVNNEKVYGNPDARFKIYEYSDVECPYCKNFFPTPKEVSDLSNGQVSVTWKNFPLGFHDPKATQEAVAVECAFKLKGNRAAWVALDRLFETTRSNGQASFVLDNFATEMGLDTAQYLNCIADPATIKAVQKDKDQAAAEGVGSTPTTIIVDTLTGQKERLSGAVGPDVLMNTIEAMNSNSTKLKPIQTKPAPKPNKKGK